MRAEPLTKALDAARRGDAARRASSARRSSTCRRRASRCAMRGWSKLAAEPGLILLAGRYEGVDERAAGTRDRPRGLDRRFCRVGRRIAGAAADRCDRAAAAGRAERRAVERRGIVCRRAARLSALHAAGAATTAARCRRCCCPATTRRSRAGGASSRWGGPGCGGRICWRRRACRRKMRSCSRNSSGSSVEGGGK